MSCRWILISVSVATAYLLSPSMAATDIIYIDPNALGIKDGSSWENAYFTC